MITKKEEAIYNSYLYASRSIKNKPTKFRRNFENISDKDAICLKKLSLFFDKYRNISFSNWFIAPYKVYSADDYFDLQFFTTRKALKCYTIYMRDREVEAPDGDETEELMKSCLSFIYNYCKDQNITVDEYKKRHEENLPVMLLHLKEHKINFYTLHALEADATIKSVESSILNFIIEDFWTIFSQTRTAFMSSKTLKEKTRKGIEIINNKLVEIINK